MGDALARAQRSAATLPSRAREPNGARAARGDMGASSVLGNQARLQLRAGGVAQFRLRVNTPGDEYEQEAERMAVATTRESPSMPWQSSRQAVMPVALRAVGKGEDEDKKKKKEDDEKRPAPTPVQRKAFGGDGGGLVPAPVEAGITSMSAGGDSLPAETRAYFEPRFGYDLGDVRTHTGADAAHAARALDAQAFTVGQHIFFGSGAYQPGTESGRTLLAHELTHTIQQQPAAARRIQRDVIDAITGTVGEGIDWVLAKVKERVQTIPGYELLTVILGRDPITDAVVERNAENLVHAVLIITPDGEAIFKDLQESKTLEKTAQWLDDQIARLDLTWEKIKGLFLQARESFSLKDLVDWEGAFEKVRRIFGPTIGRMVDFAAAVGLKLFEALKAKVLQKLSDWAHKKKGFKLLTFVLGRDPFTGEVVERTPKFFVQAVLELVPNGEAVYKNLEKSGKIDETVAWLEVEIAKLDLSWEKLKALFLRVWDVLSAKDLLDPMGIIGKVEPIIEAPAIRVINFAIAVGKKVLQFIFEGIMALAGPIGEQVANIFQKASDTFHLIAEDPIRFLNNLIAAAKLGFEQFGKNIWEHLKEGLIAWLVGALEGAGLKLPEKWDLAGIVDLVLQILGITYAKIRAKLVKVIGEEKVALIEKIFDFVYALVTKGLAAAWEKIVDAIGNLWDMVIGGIKDWAVTKIVTAAITKLATMFNPVGAVIQAIIGIYNTIAFFVERIKQILALVEAIVDSISNIALGKLEQAANYVEKTLARTLPVILGFLARLIGLGDVSGSIKKVIETIQEKVDNAIDKVIAWIVEKAKALVGAVKKAVGKVKAWWEGKQHFKTEEGEDHDLYFEGESEDAELVVATTPQRMTPFFATWDDGIAKIKDATAKDEQTKARDAAKEHYEDKVRPVQKELAELDKKEDAAEEEDKASVQAEKADKQTALTSEVTALAELLAKHNIGEGPLPPPVLPPFTSGVRAAELTRAEYLPKKTPAGSPASANSGKTLKGWSEIEDRTLNKPGGWVKMHVLTAALGGKAEDSNLVPAHGADTNTPFYTGIEKKAREALDDETFPMIWYEVKIGFHSEFEGAFPKSIVGSYGGYERKGGAWQAKPASETYDELSDIELPPEGETSININSDTLGRERLSKALDVSEYFASIVLAVRDSGGAYKSAIEMNSRMKAWANTQPMKFEDRPKFQENLDNAYDAARSPKIRFK